MSTYHHSNGEEYTITVRGNPNDDDLTVIVRAGAAEYKTTAKEIDRLPEQYRKSAKEAIADHRRNSKFEVRTPPPSGGSPAGGQGWRSYYDKLRSRINPPEDKRFEKMQEQMRQLQERLDKLEKRQNG